MDSHLRSSTSSNRTFVAALSGALVIYSSTVHLIPRFNVLYVPLSLAGVALLGFLAWRMGMDLEDLALERSTQRNGLAWGTGVAALAVVALLFSIAVPGLRPLFDDARIADIGPGLVAYRALIRIPLGTALFEEFAFRGVLFGAGLKIWTLQRAAVLSSLVFGLWHVRPTHDLLVANDLAESTLSRIALLLA
ncbi:MAG: CPBP family intramembrane metalloprotease, partial [Acidimicrobiia bacterium]|nr:CPBP family intramembrane metalloprotease [Acidimicrobiia bacterium]